MKFLLFLIFLTNYNIMANDAILGFWLSENEDAVVKIYQDKEKYFGKIVWLKKQHTGEVEMPLDIHNDNEKLKKRKLLGLNILTDFIFDKDEYKNGKVYDPKSGNTYKAYLKLIEPTKLKLRGYIGISLFGRTSYWYKQGQAMPDKYIKEKPQGRGLQD